MRHFFQIAESGRMMQSKKPKRCSNIADLKHFIQMEEIFQQENVLFKICIKKFKLVRNILADFDSGKRK